MYLSLNWVKNWIKLPKDITAKQIADDLTMATVEVEEIIDQAARLENIVVGKIEAITKHPQADKLQVVEVKISQETVKVVCGGSNLRQGMLVAFAKVGSYVKWHGEGELVKLESAKIRGIKSDGMIAAASEIGLANLFPQASETEILDLSNFKLKTGQGLAEALELDDIIIDIDNKSINHRPDLWGQYGIARELAAIYKTKLKDYEVAEFKTKNDAKLKVTVKNADKCFRYLGLVLKNIKVEESPWWLKRQLEAVGIRPINNIVDVTNYVMYELGQPLHAFDASQVTSNHIIVKSALKAEKFVTLDGVKRRLPAGALMIADNKKYVALAGIMGGQNSEISNNSTDIILESANFKASSIRNTSQTLGLRSESSARFEKSLDPKMASLAIKKAAAMILALNEDTYVASQLVDVDNNPFKEINLEVEHDLINNIFGQEISASDIKDILERLQFEVKHKAKKFSIKVPSFRATKDISIPEDIVEEVARVYGYANIKPSLPIVSIEEASEDFAWQAAKDIKNWLALSQSYDEIYTYAFTDQDWASKLGLDLKDHIKVKKAMSPDMAFMNLSLLPNLFKKAEENLRWFEEFKIFELNIVFDKNTKGHFHIDQTKKKYLPRQDQFLSGVEVSKQSAQDTFLSAKGLIESMMDYWGIDFEIISTKLPYSNMAFDIKHQDIILGSFGILKNKLLDDLNTNIAWWNLDFTLLVKYIKQTKQYKALSKYPSIDRDIAIVVAKQITWDQIKQEVSKISPLLKQVELFDDYTGKGIEAGHKSLAFHLEFRSDDKTLLAEDIDDLVKKIIANLEKKFKAKIRQ
jgi:phenylalanyl-tRNA synthetase beta chain